MIVDELCEVPSHWRHSKTLDEWMKNEGVPGISGIDTRALTKKIREKGTILGRIIQGIPTNKDLENFKDPNLNNLVSSVSIKVIIRS